MPTDRMNGMHSYSMLFESAAKLISRDQWCIHKADRNNVIEAWAIVIVKCEAESFKISLSMQFQHSFAEKDAFIPVQQQICQAILKNKFLVNFQGNVATKDIGSRGLWCNVNEYESMKHSP